MAQTVPLVAQLGAGSTGLAIGYTVLNLDRTVYAAFSTTGVGESDVPGTYYVRGGVAVPDAGGYIVVGESGTDLVEVSVDPTVLVADWDGITGEADRSILNALRILRNKWEIVDGVLLVYKEDGTTVAWTAPVSRETSDHVVTGVTP